MIPNPYRYRRQKSQGEKEVVIGEYLLLLFSALRIRLPFKSDIDAVRRVGALIARRYPVLYRVIDYYGRLIQRPSFWKR